MISFSVKYFIGYLLLFISFADSDLFAQSGFSKALPVDANVDIDDIVMHENQLILRGNIGIDSLGLWGLLMVGMDTNGILLWKSIFYDTLLESHIILNTPSRFLITKDSRLILPVKYYQTQQLAVYFTDLFGHEITHRFYDFGDGIIFPFDINEIEGDLYLTGAISYPDGYNHLFVLKLKANGDKAWIKYFGLANHFEVTIDSDVNPDQTLTIYADRANYNFVNSEQKEGWKKPWVFTIDTSGTVLSEWFGEENDPRTLGGEYFVRMTNGDWIMQGTHFKNVQGPFGEVVKSSPTITRLDSNYQLIWKKYLSPHYEERSDRIHDMDFDHIRQHIICTGQKYISIENKYEYVNWTIKFDTSGQVLWNKTDSVYYSRQNAHLTAGLDIAPSGSIYVGGYVTVNELEPRSQGFVIKYTADGCSDTICTTTSILEQIRDWDKNVILYPNPVKGELNIMIKELNGVGNIRILDLQGKCKFTDKVTQGRNVFPVYSLPDGIYFFSISSKSGMLYSGKFTICH